MKQYTAIAVLLMACMVSGCRTASVDEQDPFAALQQRARAAMDAGGFAAVGMGTSMSQQTAIDKARARGRTEIAHMVETKIDSLRKDFTEELGPEQTAEHNELFNNASKSLTHRLLSGTSVTDMRYKTEGSLTTACVLIVMSPKAVATAVEAAADTDKLYYLWRSSQTFRALQESVKTYKASQ
jgi:hypothetical protein